MSRPVLGKLVIDGEGFVDLQNGRTACLMPLTFGRARIALCSPAYRYSFDDVW